MTSLTPAQTEELREAIRRAIATVPGAFVGPLMNPLIAELKPVVETLLSGSAPHVAEEAAPRPTLTDLIGPPPVRDPIENGPVRVAFWSDDEDMVVVRVVESLDAELAEWCEDEDAPLSSADVLIAFGDVSDERLKELTHWAHMQLEEDLIAYAGGPGLAAGPSGLSPALDGIEAVIASQVARTGDPREQFLPPKPGAGAPGGTPEYLVQLDAVLGMMGLSASAWGDGEPVEEDHAPDPDRPHYTPIEGGSGTTAPFAVIMTDPGDWPYNDAFVSDDAAILHRIENDQSMPRDEVLQDVCDQMTSVSGNVDSEGQWWALVNKALDDAAIPEDRRFTGIFY